MGQVSTPAWVKIESRLTIRNASVAPVLLGQGDSNKKGDLH